jgi:WbqC-like protein family
LQQVLIASGSIYFYWVKHDMSNKVAIVQSNYIPWKGYFDLINSVDEFIIMDNIQYTRRDWRNRNKIKTPIGPIWLTIPVVSKGRYYQRISETIIEDQSWHWNHWKTIAHNYTRAKYFKAYRELFQELYFASDERLLSQVNYRFLVAICRILGINTKLSWAADSPNIQGKTERLVHLCKQAGATTYISGPSAEGYLNEGIFAAQGISVKYMDYSGYEEYDQLSPPFEHAVSIIDLIFNMGPKAQKYMKSF